MVSATRNRKDDGAYQFLKAMGGKKILIVTYYWPPGGGSGVQRWLKFVKYLSRMGWEVIVFTPENPSITIQDPSLEKDVPASAEVLRFPIWEPYRIFFQIQKWMGKQPAKPSDFIATGSKGFFQAVSAWIRGNFFIPDARIFWVKPSVSFLSDFIQQHGINRVVTTGPPHSMHLIGLALKKRIPTLQWTADFRDPWSEWDLLDTLSLTAWARRRHRQLEHRVLTHATHVITIAPYHVSRLEALSGRKVTLITNGFDEEDFMGLQHTTNAKFSIRHIGIVDQLRDPRPVMLAVKSILEANPDMVHSLRIEFIGNVNSAFKTWVQEDVLLAGITFFTDTLPHEELIKVYGYTDLQLLVLAHTAIAPGNLPGKFFEYLASGNPILAIGPAGGDAGRVLLETDAGIIHSPEDQQGLVTSLLKFYLDWKNGNLRKTRVPIVYTRKYLTEQLVRCLEQDGQR